MSCESLTDATDKCRDAQRGKDGRANFCVKIPHCGANCDGHEETLWEKDEKVFVARGIVRH